MYAFWIVLDILGFFFLISNGKQIYRQTWWYVFHLISNWNNFRLHEIRIAARNAIIQRAAFGSYFKTGNIFISEEKNNLTNRQCVKMCATTYQDCINLDYQRLMFSSLTKKFLVFTWNFNCPKTSRLSTKLSPETSSSGKEKTKATCFLKLWFQSQLFTLSVRSTLLSCGNRDQ